MNDRKFYNWWCIKEKDHDEDETIYKDSTQLKPVKEAYINSRGKKLKEQQQDKVCEQK